MDILTRINSLRNERHWSMYKLSKAANIPQFTIATWYQKNLMPPVGKLERICDALGISLASFFSNGEITELTKQQQEILSMWSSLTPNRNQCIIDLISSFQSEY